jgi:TPR repeat protein
MKKRALLAALLLPIPLLSAQVTSELGATIDSAVREQLTDESAPTYPMQFIVFQTADVTGVDAKDLMDRAQKGDAAAQRTLGNLYYEGKVGGGQDFKSAFNWLLKAAENGDAIGQNNLGVMLLDGKHWPQNFERAYYWINRAADTGLPKAQFHLGLLYIQGWGIPVDVIRGLTLVETAADAHEPYAELYLARLNFGKMKMDKAYEFSSRSYAHARFSKALSIRTMSQAYLEMTGAKDVLTRVQRLTSREEERGSYDNRVTVSGPKVKLP